jgi:hypothetical protein
MLGRVSLQYARLRQRRLQFLRAPLKTYRQVVDTAEWYNEGYPATVTDDCQQMRLYFQRAVPLSDSPELLDFFELVQSLHQAVLAKDSDLVRTRIAAGYQFFEMSALGCSRESMRKAADMPPSQPGDFTGGRPVAMLPRLIPLDFQLAIARHHQDLAKLDAVENGDNDA